MGIHSRDGFYLLVVDTAAVESCDMHVQLHYVVCTKLLTNLRSVALKTGPSVSVPDTKAEALLMIFTM